MPADDVGGLDPIGSSEGFLQVAQARARESYHDSAYPQRQCDFCGRFYTGPAVYCSLDCAMEDSE